MYHWELPGDFSQKERYERLRFHKNRIDSESAVFDFFETIEHDCDFGELCNRLHQVRDAMARVELRIELLEMPEFTRAVLERDVAIEELRQVLVVHAQLVRRMMKTHNAREQLGIEMDLRHVRVSEEAATQKAKTLEGVVICLCMTNGVDSRPYERLHEVLP